MNNTISFGNKVNIQTPVKKYLTNPKKLVEGIEGDFVFHIKKTTMPELKISENGEISHKEIPAIKLIATFPKTIKNILAGRYKVKGFATRPLDAFPDEAAEKRLIDEAINHLKFGDSSREIFRV